MLTWDDIRAIDAITDPLGVVSIYADRPEDTSGRLVRAVSLAGELRRLETELAAGDGETAAAFRRRMQDIRPALARMLEGRMPGRALFAPLSGGEVFEVAVGMPVGLAAVVEGTAYVRPLVAAIDEGRPAGVIVDDGPSLRLLAWRMGVMEEVGTYRSSSLPRTRSARALAREVRTVARERGWTRVVVAGDGRLAHILARSATPPEGEVSVFTRSVAGVGPRGLATALSGVLNEAQRRYEWRLVERVIVAGLSDQDAVLGPARTRWALDQRLVRHLLIDAEHDHRWSQGPPPPAPDRWPGRDPAEDLIERALHSGADITPVEGPARRPLGAAEGLAAILR
jgi:hypothetical protein